MTIMTLEEEIKSRFQNEYHKLEVNIFYTQYHINRQLHELMKPFGITNQQYNILRILRGQYPNPANVNLLIERMLDKMSNASRLVEKLRLKGYVRKAVNPSDKRNADIWITDDGLQLLEDMAPAIDNHVDRMKVLSLEEAQHLNNLLDKVREASSV